MANNKQEKLLDLTKTKNTRTESHINAYKRLGGEELAAEIAADWKAYVRKCAAKGEAPGMPSAGRQNHFLKTKFEAETEEVKNRVKASCKEAFCDAPGTILHKLMNEGEDSVDEKERKRCAEQLHE